LQVLYWLKQEHPPTVGAIAQGVGKHRNTTLQTWLLKYREGGIEAMLEVKKALGRVRIMPQWAEASLAKRGEDPNHGFVSYGAVQQWLSESFDFSRTFRFGFRQVSGWNFSALVKSTF
jgi:hypothetical protein